MFDLHEPPSKSDEKQEFTTLRISKANVVVDQVSKKFVIAQDRSDDATVSRPRRGRMVVDAVRNVSFVAEAGESIGIIGVNGSGKSTLLGMIAGGQSVTSGKILTRSQPTMMGVSPALQPMLSGEFNIRLGCLALGMTPAEASEQVEEIAAWTELGDAIQRPMKTYSSGMAARLAFAISTAIKPEILVIDEALSTGDAAFSAKADLRMRELLDRAGNLFLVSHSIGQIERNCERVLWMHEGRIVADGPTRIIGPQYHEWARLLGKEDKGAAMSFLNEIVATYSMPVILFQRAEGRRFKGLFTKGATKFNLDH